MNEPVKAEIKEAESKAASDRTKDRLNRRRKRIAAVYRPQNSTQMRNNRPAGQSYGGSRLKAAGPLEPETRLRKDRFRRRAGYTERQPAQPDNGSGITGSSSAVTGSGPGRTAVQRGEQRLSGKP